MKARKYLLLSALGVALAVLGEATEVKANPAGVPIVPPGPFACTTAAFRVEAIVGGGGEFPLQAACVNHAGQSCLDYGYKITTISPTGPNINDTVFAVSADIDLDRTSPAAVVSVPGAGTERENTGNFLRHSKHEYAVRFPTPKAKTHEVHIIVAGPAAPRLTTVMVTSSEKGVDTCVIAGAGVPAGLNPFQPIFQEQVATVAGGHCLAKLIFNTAGELIDVESLTPECNIGSPEGDLLINGAPLQNNISPHGITFGNNTTTCYGPPAPRVPRCICTALPCP